MIYSKYSGRAVSLLAFLPMMLNGQRAHENAVPLNNWSTPLYWQPSQAETEAAAKAVPQLRLSANAVSAGALTFVAITPCRLVDTRGAAAGFNGIDPFAGPSIPAGGTLTIPVQSSSEATANTAPAPCGVIFPGAQAYSFNVTVVPAAAGGVGYVSLWPSGSPQPYVSTLNDPQGTIVANAAVVPAGAPQGGVSVYNSGPAATDVIIDMNGYFAAPTDMNDNTAVGVGSLSNLVESALLTGLANTAIGSGALELTTTGNYNTASGASALQDNTTGYFNTASGYSALAFNTTGYFNTADGGNALVKNTTGNYNTASGDAALAYNTTGNYNTASGAGALANLTTGSNNTALGFGAGTVPMTPEGYTTGSNNIAIGVTAAALVLGANSNNIHIGSEGSANDSGTIRIGNPTSQTSFFAAGIRGVTTGSSNAIPVVIDSNGQLGTVSSSRRFKEDIEDMGEASSGLLRLRPVTFRYRRPFADGSKPIEYGLIAEEVEEVYPDLVAHSADGQIETVKYQVLDSMLLNEVQKQAEEIRLLQTRLAALEQLLTSKAPPQAPAQ